MIRYNPIFTAKFLQCVLSWVRFGPLHMAQNLLKHTHCYLRHGLSAAVS